MPDIGLVDPTATVSATDTAAAAATLPDHAHAAFARGGLHLLGGAHKTFRKISLPGDVAPFGHPAALRDLISMAGGGDELTVLPGKTSSELYTYGPDSAHSVLNIVWRRY